MSKKEKSYDPAILNDHLDNMYEGWFLDYASYVILERAVPSIEDGLKPVQRRILHAMKEMDDGRFHKVANVIGQTMQYHPHGDAAIGDALVNLGQKELLIETQGNWGDLRTGDPAAAPRYIETRLSKFGLEVAFNPDTTEWQLSYDGRKKEPVQLPMKFPMVLAQGVEGIAVGLSTKILPHNFIELIDGSIKILNNKNTKLLPDFPTGGTMDVSEYNGGKRGGKIKVRAKIEAKDKKTLIIRELPYGVTTESLIDSILKANDKGKIKIKQVVDNTAQEVEIVVELPSGVTTEKAIDALYAFTKCQESISPLACVIINDKPHFLNVNEILEISTQNTKELLRTELEIERNKLAHRWHVASLERIFIENRIYRDIEEAETWEQVMQVIDEGIHQYISTPSRKNKGKAIIGLFRDVTDEDIVRLTEIKIKRISKYDSFKADELIKRIENEIDEVENHLNHLTDYAISYFETLKKKYGEGKERKTIITEFGEIDKTAVAASNVRLYADRKEGFIGTSLKRSEFLFECSDIDDIIIIRKDGHVLVTRVDDKVFVGKGIEHAGIWKRGDERTTYNLVYTNMDKKKYVTYVKRFNVKAVTYDREYNIFGKAQKGKLQYLSVNPNAEAEVIDIKLTPGSNARKKVFDFDFAELDIRGKSTKGNILTKYPIKNILLKKTGQSTIGGLKLYVDEGTGRVNADSYGQFLGEFFGDEEFLILYNDGTYEVRNIDVNLKLDRDNIVDTTIIKKDTVITAVYYDGDRKNHYVKRFEVETSTLDHKFEFITEKGKLLFATVHPSPIMSFTYLKGREKEKVEIEIALESFIDVKGWKAIGNQINYRKPTKFTFTKPEIVEDEEENIKKIEMPTKNQNGQATLFDEEE